VTRFRPAALTAAGLALLLGLARPVAAETEAPVQLPETLPGFSANQLFESHVYDDVNLFSGDPAITIPLGPEYPLSPGLTWRLSARYSVKQWRLHSVCPSNGAIAGTKRAVLTGYPTLGAGWTLELGYVRRPFQTEPQSDAFYYVAPDGGQHRLSVDMQRSASAPPYYSLDGTRLRFSGDGSAGNPYLLEFPDGTKQLFGHRYASPVPVSGTSPDFSDEIPSADPNAVPTDRWGLTAIKDRSGRNRLEVAYAADYPSLDAWKVSRVDLKTTDAVTASVEFTWETKVVPDVLPGAGVFKGNSNPQWSVLQKVRFPLISGSYLETSFSYTTSGFQRNAFDNSWTSGCGDNLPARVAVPLLSSIVSGGAGEQTFGFAYMTDGDPNHDGALSMMTLPTGGKVLYTYGLMEDVPCFIGETCPTDPVTGGKWTGGQRPSGPDSASDPSLDPDAPFLEFTPFVVERAETTAAGASLGVTSYERDQFTVQAASGEETPYDYTRLFRRTIVTVPDGNGGYKTTKHIFAGGHGGAPSAGLELERRSYDDSTAGNDPLHPLFRDVVFCYQDSTNPILTIACGVKTSAGGLDDGSASLMNDIRLQKGVTWFDDGHDLKGSDCGQTPSKPCTQASSSLYNTDVRAFGKTNTTAQNIPSASGWTGRESNITWAPNLSEWILDLYSLKSTADSGSVPAPGTIQGSYNFGAHGFLASMSVTDGSTRSWTYVDDGLGNPGTETIALTGQTSVTVTRAFTAGQVRKRDVSGISWSAFDADRATTTGQITTSRDPNGLATSYSYDVLGRLTNVTPPHNEVPTGIAWETPTRGTVTRSGGGLSTREQYLADDFGRLVREIRQMPSGYAVRTHAFLNGLRTFDSEWGACTSETGDCLSASPAGTTYSAFDPLGRPLTVTAADGSVTSFSYTDGSIAHSETLESVTASVGGSAATTLRRKDILGRLIEVTEPAIAGQGSLTRYAYSALDKVGRVEMLDAAGSVAQTRTFTYDALGFLRSETHPEKGTTTYSTYDALGNGTSKSEPGPVAYSYTYDPAGRLLTATGGGNPFVKNCYDGQTLSGGVCSGSRGDWSKARLSQRTSYNYGQNAAAATMTEDFFYGAPAGRLSRKDTASSMGSLGTVTETFGYNALGLPDHHAHPRATGQPLFAVSTQYLGAYPVALYLNGLPLVHDVTYNPAGAIASYKTGLSPSVDVTTTITPDVLPSRPHAISAALGATSLFSTGNYAYDGAGNVTAIGSDAFTYDLRSRLLSASLLGQGTQYYTYDRFGNVLTKGATPYPVDPATNRLTSPYAFDDRGNLMTGTSGATYTWDQMDRMTRGVEGGVTYDYAYTAENERVLRAPQAGSATFTLRDPEKKVITEFVGGTPSPTVSRDNAFLGNLLVASWSNIAVSGNQWPWSFYSSDHLGTPRLLTGLAGEQQEIRKYWPYGEDANSQTTPQRLRFATMERDPEGPRYYDHARHHDTGLGRFTSPDVLGGKPGDPQSWNRYSYARGNPIRLVDPDGRTPQAVLGTAVGAVVGLYVGGYNEIQLSLRQHITLLGSIRRVGASVLGGAVSGGLGTLCGTCALGFRVGAGVVGTTGGGAVNRAIAGQLQTVAAVERDAIAGVGGAVAGEVGAKVGAAVVAATVEELKLSAAAARAMSELESSGLGADAVANRAVSVIETGVRATTIATAESASSTIGASLPQAPRVARQPCAPADAGCKERQ
jgi:RHS repeat-associated protein